MTDKPNISITTNVHDHGTANTTLDGDIIVTNTAPAPATEPLSVLFLGASPSDIESGPGRIRPEREYALIEKVSGAGHFRIVGKLAAKVTDLSGILSAQADILHLACHGTGTEMVFERDSGRSNPVAAARVAELLGLYEHETGRKLRAIVLQVCRSAEMARVFAPVADVVVSWRGEVDERVAVAFAQRFYEDLRTVQSIASAARVAVQHVATGNGWPLALAQLDVLES